MIPTRLKSYFDPGILIILGLPSGKTELAYLVYVAPIRIRL